MLSETPCFFTHGAHRELTGAALAMVADLLANPAYRRAAADIVPARFRVANGETLPTFVQVDFGLVRVGDRIEGRLVELQAFPSLYGFQLMLAETQPRRGCRPDAVSASPAGISREDTSHASARRITGGHDPAEVVLMEIDPAASEDAAGLCGDRKALGRARGGCARGGPAGPAPVLQARRRARADRAGLQPRHPRRSATQAESISPSTTATTWTWNGRADRTGSSASASFRSRSCGIRGCRDVFPARDRRRCRTIGPAGC